MPEPQITITTPRDWPEEKRQRLCRDAQRYADEFGLRIVVQTPCAGGVAFLAQAFTPGGVSVEGAAWAEEHN